MRMKSDDQVVEAVHQVPQQRAFKEVRLVDDDYTPMEVVVEIVVHVFAMPYEHAVHIAVLAHQEGHSSCGFFSLDDAERKVELVIDLAKNKGYPLHCKIV